MTKPSRIYRLEHIHKARVILDPEQVHDGLVLRPLTDAKATGKSINSAGERGREE